MVTEVLMPKLGLTMTDGTILEWMKKEGDHLSKGDILFSVETDKLTNEVEADQEGVLLKILVPVGESVSCKTVVAYLGEGGEQADNVPPLVALTASAASAASFSATPKQKTEYVKATPYAKKLAKENGYLLYEMEATGPEGILVARDIATFYSAQHVKLSPMAAKLADEMQVDVSSFPGGNRVMKTDVLAMAQHQVRANFDDSEKPEKVSALRRSIASNMSASWSISPRVTYTQPVDATNLKQLRASLKQEFEQQGIKLTYNHILILCCTRALTEFPDVNASFRDQMITRHKHVNVGLAVAKGDGLIVPNLKNCEIQKLIEIAKGTEAMIEETRTGKVTAEQMTGGTFTITSLGAYGITSFSPIINQPELAILGACSMVDTPVVRNGEVVVRPIMNLCLTADHRVIDGVMAARFLQRIVELLENPYRLLG